MNWRLIISDIQKHGLTQEEIAKKVGCRQSSISDLKCERVKDPLSSLGVPLLKLLEKLKQGGKERPSQEQGETLTAAQLGSAEGVRN